MQTKMKTQKKRLTAEEITKRIPKRFRCFGGGHISDVGNPISHALKDSPLQFALGVDVADVVAFVLECRR
jgi:hypothetical protein